MTIKWNRESLLVALMTIAILIGVFFYGHLYFVDPVKEEAQNLTETIETQQTLLEDYPPNEERLTEYERDERGKENILPIGDKANAELITLERLAGSSNVTILNVTRVSDRQAIEGMPEEYVKNTYTAQMTSDSPANFRRLIEQLMNQDRTWNISSFAYEKAGEQNYSGSINFDLAYYSTEPASSQE